MTETTAAEAADAVTDTAPPQDTTHPQHTGRYAGARRNGLAVLTGLLAAAIILRGPQDIAGLDQSVRWVVAVLLFVAFALLVRALLAASRAGAPTGAGASVRLQAAAGLALLGVGVLVGWLAPAPAALMQVTYDHGIICGQVSLTPDGYITVEPDPGQAENRMTTLVQVDLRSGNRMLTCWVEPKVRVGDRIT
ncbi:hypothetical protein, partial [Catellatospora sp. NPDC049609]|uniref:hypothetical protein n=1 Tax=Catellatospora sp. NPDC049609 TaxID=3155505 RepID=UPI003420EDE1